MSDPKYPIGKFCYELFRDEAERQAAIAEIRDLPKQLRAAVTALGEEGLDRPYREGGWTVRQLVHHIADSHMNAFIRFRLALTEENPTIKPYDEAAWAELPDSSLPVEVSLALLDSLHLRWTVMLELTPVEDFLREMTHPVNGLMSIDKVLQIYVWHGRHHLAHITHAPR